MAINDKLFSSDSQEWETPQDFFDRLHAEFNFTLDAAASPENAKCQRYYTIKDNALWQLWAGVVWCNPPYGSLVGKFVAKGYRAAQRGAIVVMLIPARTDTKYWHSYVMRSKEIRFVRGRLSFSKNGNSSNNAPFPSAVVVFELGDHQPAISTIDARGLHLGDVVQRSFKDEMEVRGHWAASSSTAIVASAGIQKYWRGDGGTR